MNNATTDMARSMSFTQRSAVVTLRSLLFLPLVLGALAWLVQDAHAAAPSPGDPTTQWFAVPYPTNIISDYITDQQTGTEESDIIGTTGLPALYTRFFGATTPTNGTIGFRVRVGKDASPAGFKSVFHVGLVPTNGNSMKLIVSVDNSGSSSLLRMFNPGGSANTSPSTTSIDAANPLFSYAESASNYNWSIVTATIDPAVTNLPAPAPNPYNLDGAAGGTNETDFFLSFFVPFQDVIAGLASNGVIGVTANTGFRYIFITASQPNSINQDINGINGPGDPPYTNIVNQPFSPNQPPVAGNDFATTPEDTQVMIPVLTNDLDPNFDAITLTNATTTNGTVSISGTNILFLPATNFTGMATITYTIRDILGLTANGTVTVNVTPVNDAPVALSQSVTNARNVASPLTLTASDPDGPTTNFVVLTLPSNGMLSGTAPNLTYLPNTNYTGPDSFTFQVNDGSLTSAVATVSITVVVGNLPPTANNQSLSTQEETPLPVLLTGSDPNGDPITFAIATGPANGMLSGFNPTNGAVTYTPSLDFNGADSFTFTVSDGSLTSPSGTITISVTPTNDAPVAMSQSLTNAEDTALPILLMGSDVDGPVTNFTVVNIPTNGALRVLDTNGAVLFVVTTNTSLGPTNGLSYLPDTNFAGADSFTFTVNDSLLTSGVATISISVSPVNDAPVASNQSLSVPEDTSLPITLTAFDVDGPATNFTVLALPTNGLLLGSAPNLTYQPNSNFFGTDSITFQVDDGALTSAVATISITVTPVNDAPVLNLAIPDQAGVYGSPFTYTFPANTFTDVDQGQTLSFTATNLPPGISFTGDTRTFSGTPLASGTFTVTVTAIDDGTPALSAFDTFDIVIAKVPLNVTAQDKVRAYNLNNPPFTFTITGFVLGDPTNVVSGSPDLSTTATPSSPTGTYPITVGQGTLAASNYSFALANGTLTVTSAVPVVGWTPLGPITYGTPLGSNQLNATSSVPGSFTYMPSNGVVLPAGTNTLNATFTPSDTNYIPESLNASLVVPPAPLSVVANEKSRPYGETNPPLTFTIDGFVNGETTNVVSGAPVLSTVATPASPIGDYPITVTAGTLAASNYTFVLNDSTLTVTPATPVLGWTPLSPIIYGTPLGSNQLNATSSVPGLFIYTPGPGIVLPTGTNALTNVFIPANTNYFTLTSTSAVVVLPATLNVTADNQARAYGETNPPFTFTITGFVNGENSSVVSGTPDVGSAATPSSPVGMYPITVGGGTLAANNYVFNLVNGILSVTNATPVVGWTPMGPITYGTPLGSNQLNATSSVPGSFTYMPSNGVVLPAGTNTLNTAFAPSDTNYAPVNLNALLVVLPAPLSVTANEKSRPYGQTNPPLTFTLSGFVNGETTNVVSGAPVLSTVATPASPTGDYPITVTAGTLAASNYTFVLNNSMLTVTPATPTIMWTPLGPIVYGTPLGTNQLNATSSVPGSFTYTPTNGVVLPAGTNSLSVLFTATDTNYTPVMTEVLLLVLKAPLTAKADDKSVDMGAPLPPLTISYTGFVNGDTLAAIDMLPTATTTATTNSPPDFYPITPAGGADNNYTFNYVNGTLTVGTLTPTLQIIRQINGYTTFNPQTSLFEQTVRLTNSTSATFTALRINVDGLPATVTLHNANGTNGLGKPYVVWTGTLAPGGSVTLLLEYFSVNRQPFAAPTLSVEVISFTPPPPPSGTVLTAIHGFMAANGRFYIEWDSVAGKTYYVQYSDNPLGPWKTVLAPVAGTGFRIVWTDDGPPKTESADAGARFYQLIVQ